MKTKPDDIQANILVVDDKADDRRAWASLLRTAGHVVFEFANAEDVIALGDDTLQKIDVAILDHVLPGQTGKALGQFLIDKSGVIDLIMLTAHPQEVSRRAAEDVGFIHHFDKTTSSETFLAKVKSIAEKATARRRIFLALRDPCNGLIGQSESMERVRRDIYSYACSVVPVLILGDTGTGKGVVAQAIQKYGERASKPFVTVNCAAIPDNLIESELFGHVRGAFTGATENRDGRFAICNGGTLFLDECGRMDLKAQAKLLRVLQKGEFEKVGSTTTNTVDVRVIAATNIDPDKAIDDGLLLPDLFERLNGHVIKLPRLRERPEDIVPLAEHFLGKRAGATVKRFSSPVRDALKSYNWPRNVRELENVVNDAVVRSGDRPAIILADLKAHVCEPHKPAQNLIASATREGEDRTTSYAAFTNGEAGKGLAELRDLCRKIEETDGAHIKNLAENLLQYGAETLKSVLALFYYHYKKCRKLERFNTLFGYKTASRPTVEVKHDLVRFSKDSKTSSAFQPVSLKNFGVRDLETEGRQLENRGVSLQIFLVGD